LLQSKINLFQGTCTVSNRVDTMEIGQGVQNMTLLNMYFECGDSLTPKVRMGPMSTYELHY
jgi:hypothetical protein